MVDHLLPSSRVAHQHALIRRGKPIRKAKEVFYLRWQSFDHLQYGYIRHAMHSGVLFVPAFRPEQRPDRIVEFIQT
ncbi:MAG: hypothetical protein J0H71_06700 [Rhizobiales bacterium]|nr:hypothetical protein [Hyphomicrobiales bacterium]